MTDTLYLYNSRLYNSYVSTWFCFHSTVIKRKYKYRKLHNWECGCTISTGVVSRQYNQFRKFSLKKTCGTVHMRSSCVSILTSISIHSKKNLRQQFYGSLYLENLLTLTLTRWIFVKIWPQSRGSSHEDVCAFWRECRWLSFKCFSQPNTRLSKVVGKV